jgi:predicted dinucleotide-binding enzyme
MSSISIIGAGTMARILGARALAGNTVQVIGRDPAKAAKAAKGRVSAFIESLALRPPDTGDLTMAHRLEGAALLMVAPALGQASKDNNFWLGINTLGSGRTS